MQNAECRTEECRREAEPLTFFYILPFCILSPAFDVSTGDGLPSPPRTSTGRPVLPHDLLGELAERFGRATLRLVVRDDDHFRAAACLLHRHRRDLLPARRVLVDEAVERRVAILRLL